MYRAYLKILVVISLLISLAYSDESSDSDLDGFNDDLNAFGEEMNISASTDLKDGFDDLDGFSDIDVSSNLYTNEVDEVAKYSYLDDMSLSGELAFKTAAGYESHEVEGIDYSGINQAQTSLYLQIDTKLSDNWKIRISGDAYYDAIYDIYSHNDYNKDVLDEYRQQVRLDDTYIQGQLSDNLDLKFGRQVVVWGKSDNIRVTDVINPTDNRLPGVTDIEYLRLPTTMAKLDYYVGDWDIAMMAIFEPRTSLNAPAGSEYMPIDTVEISNQIGLNNPDQVRPIVEEPHTSSGNMQYALAFNGVFSGWDLSFYVARIFNQDSRSENVVADGADISNFVYDKINMAGVAFNTVLGSWLIKSEAAYLNGLKYSTTDDEKDRLDVLFGIEYMGIEDTSMSLELVNRHILDFDDVMKQAPDSESENTTQTIVRITRNFMHETLEITALANLVGATSEDGGFGRLWGEYELGDALNFSLGIVVYWGGENDYLNSIRNNDRIFAELSYSF